VIEAHAPKPVPSDALGPMVAPLPAGHDGSAETTCPGRCLERRWWLRVIRDRVEPAGGSSHVPLRLRSLPKWWAA